MKLSRRKLLLVASACAGGLAVGNAGATDLVWHGYVLGADAQLRFHGIERAKAQSLLREILAEADRLEDIFSLYRPHSELSRLNREGVLHNPSQDFRMLLDLSLRYWNDSGGAFNPAVQPIWSYLSRHFAVTQNDPPEAELRDLVRHCSPSEIDITQSRVRLGRRMALTFNGIAQGYITDRAVDVLHSHRIGATLVNLGEYRAMCGKSWAIQVEGRGDMLQLENAAIAHSAGSGTPLSLDGRWHHLLNPATGKSADSLRATTAIAETAAEADALSTAYFVASEETRMLIADRFPQVEFFSHT